MSSLGRGLRRAGAALSSGGFWAIAALVVAILVPLGFAVYSVYASHETGGVLKKCSEIPARRAAVDKQPIELQTNKARPTMAISLADKPSAIDTIAFSPKDSGAGRPTIPDNPNARTSAFMIETLRSSPIGPFDGSVDAKAYPVAGARAVELKVCVTRGDALRAGAFQGTVRIYGPELADFDYAVIVTEKWPWEIAAAILWYAGLLFVIAAWTTGSLTFSRPSGKPQHGVGKLIATLTGTLLGLVAMVPAFFGTYWNNATWGSDPGTQLTGLATAGLTAALAGLAAAHKLLEKPSDSPPAETHPA